MAIAMEGACRLFRHLIIILSLALSTVTPLLAQADIPQGLPEDPPNAVVAGAKDGVKGLSWLEIGAFSPAFTPVNEALIARLEKTWKLKLRVMRRNAWLPAHINPDPNLRAQWKKLIEDCTRIIKK
jgi:hypothetical protein